jgi:drug/metabolite transporter (DMT)-like permease
MMGLFFGLAILGVFTDWNYRKQGGIRPTRRERICFGVAVGLCVATLVTLGIMGGSGAGLAHATELFTVILFSTWELGRFRIRRKHPLVPRKPSC